MVLTTAERNRRKRERKKQEREERRKEEEDEKKAKEQKSDEHVEIEYVSEARGHSTGRSHGVYHAAFPTACGSRHQ